MLRCNGECRQPLTTDRFPENRARMRRSTQAPRLRDQLASAHRDPQVGFVVWSNVAEESLGQGSVRQKNRLNGPGAEVIRRWPDSGSHPIDSDADRRHVQRAPSVPEKRESGPARHVRSTEMRAEEPQAYYKRPEFVVTATCTSMWTTAESRATTSLMPLRSKRR